MATVKPLILSSGNLEQIGSVDTIDPSNLGSGTRDGAKYLRDDGIWSTVSGGGGSSVFSTVEVDLGPNIRRSGKFNIPITLGNIGAPVLIQQAVGPYTGKGSLADEAELTSILVTASVVSSSQITAYWNSSSPVRGNVKFIYQIGA